MSKWKEFMGSIDKDVKAGVAIALAIIILFGSGNFLGGLMSKKTTVTAETTVEQTQAETQAPVTQPTAVETQPPATIPETTAAPAADATTVAASTGETTAEPAEVTQAPSTGAPATNGEIVALFNESANKIKTNATKVVRNYEDLRHDVDKLVLPSALQSIGEGLISKFLKKNETPEEYATNADIIAKYPVAGQTYVSQLTEADVAEATCTDNGTEYEIMLKLNTQTDPTAGTGVGAAFNIISADDVTSNAPMVTNFSTEYYDCVIKCKIDKATGNMTWANYTSPIILNVTAKVIVSIDATIGMTFENDYTITY